MKRTFYSLLATLPMAMLLGVAMAAAGEKPAVSEDDLNGRGPGWTSLGEADLVNVNCAEDTWSWKDGLLQCTGKPTGVIRSKNQVKDFELLVQWRHLRSGGNSGVFVWTPASSLEDLKPGKLPSGIEVQVLDHGFKEAYEKRTGKTADWFTTNGDVFAVGVSKMKPFEPTSPNGSRSFPRKETTLGVNQWNQYYIRAIDGTVRLWVNGEEVSGGSNCNPASGYFCLESEGSPIEFRNLRIRLRD